MSAMNKENRKKSKTNKNKEIIKENNNNKVIH